MENWKRIDNDSMPQQGTRVLISDGETITIAYYMLSQEHINWFFDNEQLKDLDIQWWSNLPDLPPRIKRAEESSSTVD